MTPADQDAIESIQTRLKEATENGGVLKTGLFIFLVIMALGTAWSAVYTVPSDSVAVVERFGKHLKEVPPGLHVKLPWGIDTTTIVPVKRQLK